MPITLSSTEIEAYRAQGLLFPKPALSAEKATEYLATLEQYEAETGGPVNGKYRYKCHLVFPWINELMRNEAILDMVEDLIGPDIMVWSSHLYPKEPGDGRFISWHQDSAHWGLETDNILTVWVALTPATRNNGCMRMLPGSQTTGTVEHRDTWETKNILTRGQTIADTIDEERAVWVELEPGQASIHHLYMWHSSPPNVTDERRVAVALRYVTPRARQTRADRDFATLVRGQDAYGHFEAEPRPRTTMEPEMVRLHEEIAEVQGAIYLKGTDKAGIEGLADPT
jgi:non-haem Fe2+, alpha-ketoglutarate-dependent halogenase